MASRISDRWVLYILVTLQNVMERNPYAQVYKTLYDRYQEHSKENIKLQFHRALNWDERRFNIPATSAIAEEAAKIEIHEDGYKM